MKFKFYQDSNFEKKFHKNLVSTSKCILSVRKEMEIEKNLIKDLHYF